MFVIILLIMLIALTMGVMALVFNKQDIIHIIVSALIADTAVYAVISRVLYAIRKYTIERSLMAVIMIAVVLIIIMLLMKRHITYSFSVKRNVIPVMMVLALGIVSFFVIKSGYYGLDDSIGAVQSKAMKFKDEYYIYGLTDDEYYENIYTSDELLQVKQVLEPLEQRQESAGTEIASIMALIGSLFGYEAMAYTYVYILSLVIYLVYMTGEVCLIKKAGKNNQNEDNSLLSHKINNNDIIVNIKNIVTLGATVISIIAMIILFSSRDVVISWNELNQIDRMSNETSAYVIDKDMLNELYIPVKCMTMGYIIPETGDLQTDERRFFIPEDYQLNECSNFNIITDSNRFNDEYIESLSLSRAYNERYCVYRNNWRYYYDGNYENADTTCNYFYIGIVLIGIIALMYSIGAIICRYRSKIADGIACVMGAIIIYAVIYTIIMSILISGFNVYTGSLLYSGIVLSTLISILLSSAALVFAEHKNGKLHDIAVKYQFSTVSAIIACVALIIACIINSSMPFSSGLAEGALGNIQASAVSYITGNTATQDMVIYQAVKGFNTVLASWMVFIGGILGINRISYAYTAMAVIGGAIAGIVIYCITNVIITGKDTQKSAGTHGKMALAHVCMILSYTLAVVIISIVFANGYNCENMYSWNKLNSYISNIKASDIVVADEDINPAVTGIIKAVRNTDIIRNNTTQDTFITELADVQKLAGIDGNQIYYMTQRLSDIKNTEFMLYNNVEYSLYNLDIYQKYSVINKDDNICIYKIDKSVSGKEVAQ